MEKEKIKSQTIVQLEYQQVNPLLIALLISFTFFLLQLSLKTSL